LRLFFFNPEAQVHEHRLALVHQLRRKVLILIHAPEECVVFHLRIGQVALLVGVADRGGGAGEEEGGEEEAHGGK